MADRYLKQFAVKNNAEGHLDGSINAGSTSIALETGDGALFPLALTGTATSSGDTDTLNDTGIAATGIEEGDTIYNVNDASWAVVVSVSTNSIETTPLQGGSDNLWQSGDVWITNPFVATFVQYNTQDTPESGVSKRERALVYRSSGDTLVALDRGYDGDTAQSFTAGDNVYLFVESSIFDAAFGGIKDNLMRIVELEADVPNYLRKDGSVIFNNNTNFSARNAANSANVGLWKLTSSDVLEFQTLPRNPSSRSISNDYDIIDKKYAADNLLLREFSGSGADGALDTSGGTVNINLGGAAVVVKNYTSINVVTNNLTFTNPHTNGTIVILKSTGNVVISAGIVFSGMGAAGGTGGAVGDGADGTDGGAPTGQLTGDSAVNLFGTKGTGNGAGTPAGGATAKMLSFYANEKSNSIYMMCGAGGGGGEAGKDVALGTNGGAGGNGGRGGGALAIFCGGSWNFTGTVTVAGLNGTAGSASPNGAVDGGGGGGGGGGAGGMFYALYKTLVANSGTVTYSGGNGGNGGNGGHDGGGSTQNGGCGGGGGGGYGGSGGTGGSAAGGTVAGTGGGGSTGSGANGGNSGGGGLHTSGGGGGGGAGGYSKIAANTYFLTT